MIFIKAPEHDATAGNLAVENTVRSVSSALRERGDAAGRQFSQRFDGTSPDTLEVGLAERDAAVQVLDPQIRADTGLAIERVRTFAEAMKMCTHQWLDRRGAAAVAPSAIRQSASEGLEGHRRAAALRLDGQTAAS